MIPMNESILYRLERVIVNNWLLIQRWARLILKRAGFDLTFEQIMVLHMLNENDGRSLSELAQAAGRERTTLTRMIDGLKKRNLVAIIPDRVDRRQKLVYLTDSGREKHNSAHCACNKLREIARHNISEIELESTLQTLQRISDNLEKEKSVCQ